jgi:hypothetical protein
MKSLQQKSKIHLEASGMALSDFERDIIEVMITETCTMSEALDILFKAYEVDTKSVISLVDFLEEMLYDLDKVQMMMEVYTEQVADFYLRELLYDEKKDDES